MKLELILFIIALNKVGVSDTVSQTRSAVACIDLE